MKKTIFISVFIFLIILLVSCSTHQNTTTYEVSEASEIGQQGPAKGFIFYENPNIHKDGWRYLEAAPEDLEINGKYRIPWRNKGIKTTDAIERLIGSGRSNTDRIVSIQGEGGYAAYLCYDFTLNGYDDWFLPSSEELDLIYKNLKLKDIGNFESDFYWSSTEASAFFVVGQYFGYGYQTNYFKYCNLRARAIRFVK